MKNRKILILAFAVCIGVFFSFQSRFFEIAKQIEIYNTLFKELNINYINEINPGEITNTAIKNTLKTLDPYTNFYNEQDVEDVRIRREGEYGGIGVLSYYTKKGIVLTEIYKGFPADKAGLKAGDIITKVDDQELNGLDRNQLSQVLKGTPSKQLRLEVKRKNQALQIPITLDKIVLNPVPYYTMLDEEIGYIVLTRFTSQKATQEVIKAFKELKEKGMQKLVFDLRNNPGGSLFDAVNITNIFIPRDKKVVDTRGKISKNTRTYKTKNDPIDAQIPLVVLINDRSASASEIVSGALQDYDRAVVLGKRSFGKGLVQRYFNLNYGTQMKATISKYYTPSGRCIQELDYANRDPKTGVVPKFSDGNVSKFYTEGGRTVFDGGGVTPDVSSELSDKNTETKNLLKSRVIFNFVSDYISKNPNIDSLNYTFDTKKYGVFKNYLFSTDTSYVTKEERLFKEAYSSVSNKRIIENPYRDLELKLKRDKIEKISKNQDVIVEKIEKEILKQLYYKEGMYRHFLQKDPTVEQAISVLKNEKKYRSILTN